QPRGTDEEDVDGDDADRDGHHRGTEAGDPGGQQDREQQEREPDGLPEPAEPRHRARGEARRGGAGAVSEDGVAPERRAEPAGRLPRGGAAGRARWRWWPSGRAPEEIPRRSPESLMATSRQLGREATHGVSPHGLPARSDGQGAPGAAARRPDRTGPPHGSDRRLRASVA